MNPQNQGVSPWLVLITVMVGTLLIGLDRTVVNLGLPKIINDFSITVSMAGWVATAYIISNAVFVPVFGKLGDMIGNRIIYLWSFIGFIVISLFAGLSWNIGSLIFFRTLQGLVGAAIYPTAMSLIAHTFTDRSARAQALGIWSASFAVSAVIGPLLGGPLIDAFSWRMLFYINFPIGIVGLIMTLIFLPHDRPDKKFTGFDYKGALVLAVALTSAVLVIDRGQDWGWLSVGSLICYASAVIFSFAFYFVEKKATNAIVDLKLFKNSVFVTVLVASFVTFGGMMGTMYLIPIFAQTFLGYDATETGYIFIPMAIGLFISSPIGGKLSSIFQPRFVIATGIAIATFGIWLFSGLDPRTTGVELATPLFLFALGLGFSMAPLTAAATNCVPNNEVGVASAVLNLVRNISGALGIAFFGTLLTGFIETNVLNIAASSVVHSLDPAIHATARALIVLKAEVEAYAHVFLISSGVMSLGVIVAFFLKEPKSDYEGIDEEEVARQKQLAALEA
jgi:EmrB/QacA subfamily drug resistance transporter